MVLALTLLAAAAGAAAAGPTMSSVPTGLAATCTAARCEITVDGVVFSSAPTASVHAEGRWCHSADGTLVPAGPPRPLAGADGLGPFTGTALAWKCGSTLFETSVRTYHAAEGDAVVFGQRWPDGAGRTALGPAVLPHAGAEVRASSDGCALEPETDFNGGDFARLSAASPEACCALCQLDERCAVFTYYTDRKHAGARAHCDLKTAMVRKLTNQPNHTAGSCRPPTPGPPTPAQQLVLSAFPRLAPPAAAGVRPLRHRFWPFLARSSALCYPHALLCGMPSLVFMLIDWCSQSDVGLISGLQAWYATVYNQMVGGMADGTRYGAWDAAAVAAAGGVPSGTMAGPMMLWTAGYNGFDIMS